MSNTLNFLNDFKKDMEKAGIDVGKASPPRYWTSTGNYVLNKIISGSFLRGLPQGRILNFSGASGTGKSFLIGNCMREAQQDDQFVVVIDSEHALDDDFVSGIGVDVNNNYLYTEVNTIPQTKKTVSNFIQKYKKEYDNDINAPKVLMVIDSLDMLLTETEEEQFIKGVTKGDQGQRNKQLKAMLRSFVQAIKHLNITILVTSQVYKNQDILNGEGNWIVSDAVKFSLSQIVLLSKLKLKDKDTKKVQGIKMKCEGYKTRFTKPFQTVSIEVPYDTGMDPFSGLLDVAVSLDICVKKGSRYSMKGQNETWFSKNFNKVAPDVLMLCEETKDQFLDALIDDSDIDDLTPQQSAKQKRKEKVDNNE